MRLNIGKRHKFKKIKVLTEEETSVRADLSDESIWDKIGRICLYFLVFLTPLFFLPWTIAPVEINKQILVISLTLLAFLCYLINVLIQREISYPKSLISLAVLILLAVFGISAIFSKAGIFSFWGNFIQTDTLFNFLIFGLVFFLAASFYRTNRTYYRMLGWVFYVSLILTAIFGLLQIFGKFIFGWDFTKQIGFNTIGSLYGWGIFLAFGLVMIIVELIEQIGLIGQIRLIRRIGLILTALLILFCLLILNYQFVWLGLALTMLFVGGYKFISSKQSTRFQLFLLLMTVFLSFTIINRFIAPLIVLPQEIRLNLINTLEIAGKSLWWERLPVGSGLATFSYDYNLFKPAEMNQTIFWQTRFDNGFSFLTTSSATVGVLGVLAILFLIFSVVNRTYRTNRIDRTDIPDKPDSEETPLSAESHESGLPISAGVFFLMLSWFFFPSFFAQQIFVFFGLGLLSAPYVKSFFIDVLTQRRALAVFIAICVLISLNLVGLFFLAQKYLGAIYYNKGLQAGNLSQSLAHLDKVRMFDSSSDQYSRTLSQALLLRLNELTQKGVQQNALEVQNTSVMAVQFARQATEVNPADSLNWSNLASVYENLIPLASGAEEFAETNYRKALSLDSQNPDALTNLARALLISADRIKNTQGETNIWKDKIIESKQLAGKAIALKGDYSPGYFWLAQGYLRENNLDQAVRFLEIVQLLEPDNQLIRQIIENLRIGQ